MPNYRNSVIYKLICKDSSITDTYIGSTTNPVKRNTDHRKESKTGLSKKYVFIREHGGYENWKFIIIERYPCDTWRQLRAREQHWADIYQSTLNSTGCFAVSHKDSSKRWYDKNQKIILQKKKDQVKCRSLIKSFTLKSSEIKAVHDNDKRIFELQCTCIELQLQLNKYT